MLRCGLILLFDSYSLPSVTLLVIFSLLFSTHCVWGFFLVCLLWFLFLLLFFWHFFCTMFLSSCFFLSWSWKFPGNVLKALVSTHCPIQWCSAIAPLPQKSPGLWINAVFLDSDLRSSFLYTEHMFSAASENSFSESWTAWSFFCCLLASVEILFSILFHSQTGFGCLYGIYISSVPVLRLRKKKVRCLGFSVPPAFISSLFPS